jgi:predicted metal-dependent peptidase
MQVIDKTKVDLAKQSERLKKAHVFLLRHDKVIALSGIIVMGKSEVVENVPTAYTDGLNKRYGAAFLAELTDAQVNGLVMHENGHVFYRHVTHHKRLFKDNPRMCNIAADFVVNDMIVRLDDAKIQLPPGALWNLMFRNWSVVEVYDYLKKRKKELEQEGQGQGTGSGNNGSGQGETQNKANAQQTDVDEMLKRIEEYDSLDEHGHEEAAGLNEKEIAEKVDRALRQGGMLAGILGGKRDRAIEDLLAPRVDWREVLRDFVMSACNGKDDYSWRRFNRRHVANDMYLPSTISERVGELVVAIDTSGSIGGEQLSAFASELVSICDAVVPEKVRVVWWDADVHGEQAFTEGQYAGIAKLLKPVGGGGTRVSCVGEYLVKNNVNAECVILFTDGHVENDVRWEHTAPLLWLITHNKSFVPPVGQSVTMKED